MVEEGLLQYLQWLQDMPFSAFLQMCNLALFEVIEYEFEKMWLMKQFGDEGAAAIEKMVEWNNERIILSVPACCDTDSIAGVWGDLLQDTVGLDGTVVAGG